jgi:nicotinate phosphoribosyltransferase
MLNSLLDTDLYKFTMMQVVLHQFPGAQVEYRFRCRTEAVDLRVIEAPFRAALTQLCSLRFNEDELAYLRKLRYIKPDFVDFLRLFQLNEAYVELDTRRGFELVIRGPWLHTILFEVPLLAMINELYFQAVQSARDAFALASAPADTLSVARQKLNAKIALVRAHPDAGNFVFSDFGTRRRFSAAWQTEVVSTLKHELPAQLSGTSNVLIAKTLGITAIGTMAHEYLQAFQALGPRLADSQRVAFEAWASEYRGDLGIALSDVVGMDAFLRDFDLYFCKLFDGVRHDSGEPIEWGEKMLAHYHEHRIDARAKTLVFSDGLTMQSALALHDHFIGRTRPVFGIGTHLTCDVGESPINIVIKMVSCNGQPVAKLSDSPGKTMCDDPLYLAYLRQVFSAQTTATSHIAGASTRRNPQ